MARREPKARTPERSARFAAQARALGKRVRQLRAERGWTQEQAAERTRLDLKHLQKVESGSANVTLATLLRIADGFGESIAVPFAGAVAPAAPAARGRAHPKSGERLPPTGRLGSLLNPIPVKPQDPEQAVRNMGRRIAELRLAHGMTQRELARAANVSPLYVRRVESGRQKRVAARDLGRLGALLGVELVDLLRPAANPSPRRGRPPRRIE